MCPLRSRMDHRRRRGAALAGRVFCMPDLNVLITHKLHTGTSMLPAAPVTPEEGRTANGERVEQHTHLASFARGLAIPLTLLAQRTRTTTVDAGSIDHPQASIGFSALLMRDQLLVGGAPQCPIGLESKVLTREAAGFPGQAHVRGSVARGGSGVR